MNYFILIACLLISFYASEQDCSKELLRKKTGTWKAELQGSIYNVSAADLAKEKSILGSIQEMLKKNYSPTGCQVSYSTVYGKYPLASQTFIADPYYYVIYILRYLCDNNSADKSNWNVDMSTPTTINITANAIYSLNSLYAANIPADDFRGYLKLIQRPQKKDCTWGMCEEVMEDTSSEIKEYRWLITYNDTLPFSYLSRKEYLLIQEKKLEQKLKDNPGEKDYTNKFISNVDEYSKNPDVDLNKTAICIWNDEERFEKFVDEGTNGSFIAIRPNLDYYHKKLPHSAPQFFTAVYKISAGDPVFEEKMANIKKAIDFAFLKKYAGQIITNNKFIYYEKDHFTFCFLYSDDTAISPINS